MVFVRPKIQLGRKRLAKSFFEVFAIKLDFAHSVKIRSFSKIALAKQHVKTIKTIHIR